MGKLDRASGIFWLAVSVSVCIQAHRLGLGSFQNPGPGFLFFWCGIILGVLSMTILIRALLGTPSTKEGQEKSFENVKWTKILLIVAGLVTYGLILERLGFLLSTLFFIAFLLRSIEAKKWYVVVLIALAGTLLTYGLFELALQSRLPKGFLGM